MILVLGLITLLYMVFFMIFALLSAQSQKLRVYLYSFVKILNKHHIFIKN